VELRAVELRAVELRASQALARLPSRALRASLGSGREPE